MDLNSGAGYDVKQHQGDLKILQYAIGNNWTAITTQLLSLRRLPTNYKPEKSHDFVSADVKKRSEEMVQTPPDAGSRLKTPTLKGASQGQHGNHGIPHAGYSIQKRVPLPQNQRPRHAVAGHHERQCRAGSHAPS